MGVTSLNIDLLANQISTFVFSNLDVNIWYNNIRNTFYLISYVYKFLKSSLNCYILQITDYFCVFRGLEFENEGYLGILWREGQCGVDLG